MRTDLARSLRRLRPQTFTGALTRRSDSALIFVDGAPLVGARLLLDTSVYIDGFHGELPASVKALLATRTSVHISVALGELSHNFGRLNPAHPDTPSILAKVTRVINDIPRHRLEDGSAGVLLEAGILSGLVFRLGGFQPGQEVAALNDATIYLHALDRGYAVLTRNIRDFDLMNQILPGGQVVFYRTI